jgi:hypothetical protein
LREGRGVSPFVSDPDFQLYVGDVRDVLRELPDGSVDCCVTSPPYWGLRDYGHDGQIGMEETPADYVVAMVEVFREVRRVLSDVGTLWLNLGDSYASNGKGGRDTEMRSRGKSVPRGSSRWGGGNNSVPGLKAKDLVGIPWRTAFALQEDGWWLRSDIVWAKPNPMPEAVTDRPTKAHELPEKCILAGCPKGGTVLDPFLGSGTTSVTTSTEAYSSIPAPPTATSRRRCSIRHAHLAAIEATGWDGLTTDELGQVIHADKHDPREICAFCGSAGRAVAISCVRSSLCSSAAVRLRAGISTWCGLLRGCLRRGRLTASTDFRRGSDGVRWDLCRIGGIHSYATVLDCRSHEYAACSRCAKRKVRIKVYGGYFPIDRHWLATGEWRPPPKVPPSLGGSSG